MLGMRKRFVWLASLIAVAVVLYAPGDKLWEPINQGRPLDSSEWKYRIVCAVIRPNWCAVAATSYPELKEKLHLSKSGGVLEWEHHEASKEFCAWVMTSAIDGDARAQWAYTTGYYFQGGDNYCGARYSDLVMMLDTPAGRSYRPSRIFLALLYGEEKNPSFWAVARRAKLFSDDTDDAALFYKAAALDHGIGVAANPAGALVLYQKLLSRLPRVDFKSSAPDTVVFQDPDQHSNARLMSAAEQAIKRINGASKP